MSAECEERPPKVKDEHSESFGEGTKGFAKQFAFGPSP